MLTQACCQVRIAHLARQFLVLPQPVLGWWETGCVRSS